MKSVFQKGGTTSHKVGVQLIQFLKHIIPRNSDISWSLRSPDFSACDFLLRGSAAAHLLGLWVRIPPRTWMSVSCDCYVFPGTGFCNGPIP